jgi:hypothetical protein
MKVISVQTCPTEEACKGARQRDNLKPAAGFTFSRKRKGWSVRPARSILSADISRARLKSTGSPEICLEA